MAEIGKNLWRLSGIQSHLGSVTNSETPRTISRRLLSLSKDGDTTTYPGHAHNDSVILVFKRCFFIFRGILLCSSLCPLPLVLALGTTEKKPDSVLSAAFLQVFILIKIPPYPPPSLIVPALPGFSHQRNAADSSAALEGLLGSLQYIHISPVLKPKNRHRVPGVASLILYKRGMITSLTHLVILYSNASQMPFSFFAARTHCWFTFKSGVTRTSRSSSFPAGWPMVCTSSWGCSFILSFALPLVELPEILGSPFIQIFEVPLDVTVTLWHVSHSSSFSVMSKLAESTLCPNIWTINEDAKQKKH